MMEWWMRCKNIKGNGMIMQKGCPLNIFLGMHFKVPVDGTFFAVGYVITVIIISIKA